MLDAVDILDPAGVGDGVAAGLEDPAERRQLWKHGVTGLASETRLAGIAGNGLSPPAEADHRQKC